MQDLGNPNFFKIFQGKGEVALHDGVTSTWGYVVVDERASIPGRLCCWGRWVFGRTS